MDRCEFPVDVLPDIEIYGGETTPWEIDLRKSDGTRYSVVQAAELTCTLYVASYGTYFSTPILTKVGEVTPDENDMAIIVFKFDTDDTKDLKGKFFYQIDVEYEDEVRISQGHLIIKQNIGTRE